MKNPSNLITNAVPFEVHPPLTVPIEYYDLQETIESITRGIAQLKGGEGTYLEDSDLATDE